MRLLELEGVVAGYGSAAVLRGVSLHVDLGECVAVLGRNGAGKTTLMRTISGVHSASGGSIRFDGSDIGALSPSSVARLGIAHVQEGRRIFRDQTVADNLELGARAVGRSRSQAKESAEEMYDLFPVLGRKAHQSAGLLSGGEQQMLAISQALMARPRLLLLDEPSAGLAPALVNQLFQTLGDLTREGMTILLAEQYVSKALQVSQRAYVLDRGAIALSGDAEVVSADERLWSIYIGE